MEFIMIFILSYFLTFPVKKFGNWAIKKIVQKWRKSRVCR